MSAIVEAPYNEEIKRTHPMAIVESAESATNHSCWSINNFDSTVQWPEDNSKIVIGVKVISKSIGHKHDAIAKFSAFISKINNNNGTTNAIAEAPSNEETKRIRPVKIVEIEESMINRSGWSIQQDVKAWELDEEKIRPKHANSKSKELEMWKE